MPNALPRYPPDRSRYQGERCRSRSGLDTPQPGRQVGREDSQIWKYHAYEAARSARGNRAGVRISRRAFLFKLHHG